MRKIIWCESLIDIEKELDKNSPFVGEIKSYTNRKEILFITKGIFETNKWKRIRENKYGTFIWYKYEIKLLQ